MISLFQPETDEETGKPRGEACRSIGAEGPDGERECPAGTAQAASASSPVFSGAVSAVGASASIADRRMRRANAATILPSMDAQHFFDLGVIRLVEIGRASCRERVCQYV